MHLTYPFCFLCDGWLPIVLPSLDLDAKIKELKDQAEKSGRTPNEISVSCIIPAPLVNEEMIYRVKDSDVERVILGVPPGKEDAVIPALDKLAKMVL